MKVNDIICGFEVRRVRQNQELGGTLWEMTHLKTNAELVWVDNGEDNKLFSIAFKTIPWDDTGVFHILEHSVLCGSERFPVKEPFVELLKSSMSTFLNAMTFPDKTLYPVSSRNEQDFMNLTQVYLDAVFAPAVYENPCIFWQEGWHYELHEEDEAPIYKGVVFNEMKGAFSSSDTLLGNALMRKLYPDTCYRYVSGGDPKHIPDLSYEQFLSAHREYYHPSNAKIWLDGAVPLERVLTLVDSYLSRFKASENSHGIPVQTPTPASKTVEYYEIGEDEDTAFMTHMTLGKVVCDWRDRKKLMALTVLSSYLTGSNEAPLKRAVLSSGLAQDVGLGVMDGVAQPYCFVDIRNTEYEHRDAIKDILCQTVQRLITDGLDKDQLEAVINQLEFQVLLPDEPKGLMRNITALNAWLYGGDPMLYLTHRELFAALRQAIGSGYYEDLLREVILDGSNMAEVYLLPSKTKGDEERRLEHERLAYAYSKWTAQERDAVLAMNRRLESWQSTEDTPEALGSLPTLSLSEVSSDPQRIITEEFIVDGRKVLLHKVDGNGIIHINLYFSLADFQPEELSAISFMTNLLGELPTVNHSVLELQQQIKRNIGAIDYNVTAYSKKEDSTQCRPYFAVSCSILEERVPAAMALVAEILTDTVFTGAEAAEAIGEILLQGEEGMRQSIMMDGHRFASSRAMAHFSADAAAQEQMEGYSFYVWLRDFAADMPGQMEAFQCFAEQAADRIFHSGRLTLSVTAKERALEAEAILSLLDKNREQIPEFMEAPVDGMAAKEAIQIPAGISYAVSAGNLLHHGGCYDGGLAVLATILSYGYLWNEVRVQGGAYGCGFRAGETGNVMFYSYRDPDPHRSLRVFGETARYVRALCASGETLDKYIISTVAASEPLMTAAQKGAGADADYFCQITYEDRRRIRSQMLNLTADDLHRYCNLLEAMSEQNARCIVGGSDALTPCGKDWAIHTL